MNWKAALLIAVTLTLAGGAGASVAWGAEPPSRAAAVAPDQVWAASLQNIDDLVSEGKSDEALTRLRELLKTAPRFRSSEVHLRLASIFAQQHQWDEAVVHGHDAIEAWPDNGWIYLPVARILVSAGRPEAAIALCNEASRHDPAVRLAAQDLIDEIQAGSLSDRPSQAPTVAPVPKPAASSIPYPLFLTVLCGLVALLGGMLFWLWRKQWIQPLLTPEPGLLRVDRVEQTGPVTYGPLGVRMHEPGEVIDHYRILRVVGSSLHSILYCAEDIKLGRQVALKQVGTGAAGSDAILSRFHKEVQSLIALSNHHDGVVKVFDYIEPSTLVTEWVDGENLEECEQLPLDEILAVGIALCDVLAFAHARGIVHRDIKPSNIMRTLHTRHVKLLDFGIAKNTALGTSNLTLDANVPIGTFTYMPPEQFAAPNQAKPQADVYSLGLTLYRLITAEMPTEPWLGPRTFGLIPTDQFRAIALSSPGVACFLRTAPPGTRCEWLEPLNRIIRRAFEENPADRYPDALVFKRELEGIGHQLGAITLG